ncbi:hypothetical protein [Cryobacterium sp. N19]|uniref:hypothetical protein n=1 Tax=Cryobacterium sp. N19 TaxID=2048288 RepID=UPI001E45A6EA|nr:hypothetical protein [Cryobacterium sp. N19]
MSISTELIYCLRGTLACQTHRVAHHAWERYINSELAALTRVGDAELNEAIITGIWGEKRASSAKAACQCGWDEWSVSDRGNNADWLAYCSCRADQILTAEHKPRGAVAHWNKTTLAAYSSDAITSRESMDWLRAVDAEWEQEHNRDSCQANHPRFYRDTYEKCHLAGPQILTYSQIPNSEEIREVTVIHDGSSNVNAIWETNDEARPQAGRTSTQFPIFLDTKYFPVRTTAEVLNGIAAVLPRRTPTRLTDDQQASLRAIFEAMWVRAGTPEISLAAESWIREDVRLCVGIPRHDLRDEDQPSEHDFRSWSDYSGSAPHEL